MIDLVKEIARFRELCRAPEVLTLRSLVQDTEGIYLVGGAVREVLTGQEPRDLDFCVSLEIEEFVDRAQRAGIRCIPTGLKHGTTTVLVGDRSFEVTTLRPAPDLKAAQQAAGDRLLADLLARDFTINSVAFDPRTERVIDYLGGVQDLRAAQLRTSYDPKVIFKADPLRLLRMIRFGPADNRTVDSETLTAAKELAPLLGGVSQERIQVELVRVLCSQNPRAALMLFYELGFMEILLPELLPMVGCDQNKYHVEDVFQHTLSVIERTPADPLLRLAALLHDAGKPATLSIGDDGERHFYQHEIVSEQIAYEVLSRLKCSHKLTNDVAKIVRYHMRPLDCGPSAVRRLIRDLDQLLPPWRIFKEADKTPTASEDDFLAQALGFDRLLEQELTARTAAQRKLAINGHDLMELGMQPGKALGAVLSQIDELILERPELNTREQLLPIAREMVDKGANPQ